MEVQSQEKHKNWPIVLLLLLMYVIVAMSDNFKGIFVPLFKEDFGVSNTQIGYVLTACLFMYALFQYIGGILIERFGYKKIISLGIIIAMGALVLLVTCKSFWVLVIGLSILNSGIAMFNVGVNTLGPVMTVASTAVLMNFVNFSYGTANTTMQQVTGSLLKKGVQWQTFYLIMLFCCVALFIYLLLLRIPYKPQTGGGSFKKRELFHNKLLYLYIAAIGFYVAAEYGIGNWFVNYMSEEFSLDAERRALYMTLFFGLMTFGRIFGGFIADKLGYFRSVLIYGSIASVLCIIGISLGKSGLILFAASGLFFSLIYPTLMSTIRGTFKEGASYVTGLILMCGTLIAMAVNLLIGIANDSIGVYYSFYIVAVCLILSTLAVLPIRKWAVLTSSE
ncbi:MFS transporter [Paenibacillus wynnii]|uniref:MFS transporter n=1 Tax=Paenibacillus wynnii TaxID=268407 RepID=UPI002790ED1B|nr:MFS transporter [Paenibacillus wynnii]MDQ0195070.1 fucose permease [Paenibacillus wynnii]